jgi:hypothetical protein
VIEEEAMAPHDENPGERVLDLAAVFLIVLGAVLLMVYVTGIHFPSQAATVQDPVTWTLPAAPPM